MVLTVSANSGFFLLPLLSFLLPLLLNCRVGDVSADIIVDDDDAVAPALVGNRRTFAMLR